MHPTEIHQNFEKGSVYEAIRQASQHVPRYLFRAWCPASGGDSELNTETHVIPSAFKTGYAPGSIFDVDEETLRDTIFLHIGGGAFKTFFSSWSPMLSFALSLAMRSGPEAHIAVVDTTKLSARNHVYWTASRHLTDAGIMGMPEEYHIFGGVSGPGYQALPLANFIDKSDWQPTIAALSTVPDPFRRLLVMRGSAQEGIQEAVRVGQYFNSKFGLVMAVYLLAMRGQDPNERALDALLEAFVVPSDVADGLQDDGIRNLVKRAEGSTIAPDMGFAEMMRANATFRWLAERRVEGERQGFDSVSNSQEKQAAPVSDQDTSMQDEQPSPDRDEDIAKPQRTAVKMVGGGWEERGERNSGEVPKEVRDLEIDMLGEEEHNEQLKR